MSTNISLRAKKITLILLVAILITMLSYMFNIKAESNKNVLNNTSNMHNNPSVETELTILEEIKSEIRLEEKQKVSVQETINMNQYNKVTVVATGYTAGVESTGKTPGHPQYGITFSGVKVQRDPTSLSTIAADIDVFPLGTILFIPGYGYGIVADTGSAIKGHKIDLYYDSVEDVYQEWGKKKIEVYIIQKGNGKLTEELLKQYEQVAIGDLVM